ncbi:MULTISPECIES: YegJ family protein [Sphingobacterium]|jgi:uncharacterized protein YegJ (DUF2314 family)|uniref:YegJ family protein n=1 Tax=Sphingobacterium TaxID=28453 RepID=UPI002580EAF2|nr:MULTISPECIES: DUF2314 domain-containing protein [Sphingobacterium]MDF2850760.1 hypothetical protein [Sphingobacterium multivorum]
MRSNILRPILFVAVSSALLLACQSPSIKDKIENDEVIGFRSDDEAMNAAIVKAKNSLNQFVQAVEKPQEGYEAFALKIAYDTPDKSLEHIWVGDISYQNGQFTGVVSNSPVSTKEVAFGDTVVIDKQNISDWMYLDKGILRGGYTIRAMRDQLSGSEKEEFNKSIDFVIED